MGVICLLCVVCVVLSRCVGFLFYTLLASQFERFAGKAERMASRLTVKQTPEHPKCLYFEFRNSNHRFYVFYDFVERSTKDQRKFFLKLFIKKFMNNLRSGAVFL